MCELREVGASLMGVDTQQLDKVFATRKVEIAYLFGSQARGEAGPLSDVDIAVLFPEDMDAQARFRAKLLLASQLPGLFGLPRVDVVDLADAPPVLAFSIIKEGKVIRSEDEGRRVRFESLTMVRYYDTAHMRKTLEEAIFTYFRGRSR